MMELLTLGKRFIPTIVKRPEWKAIQAAYCLTKVLWRPLLNSRGFFAVRQGLQNLLAYLENGGELFSFAFLFECST